MLRDLARSFVAVAVITVLCGIAYPVAVWAVAQTAAGGSADGSLVVRDGRVIGSHLIGQPFTSDRYFHGRPSAVAYAAGRAGVPASGGSNLGPTSRELAESIASARREVAARERVAPARVPVDLVTASASGLDPDISLDAALIQVDRVARSRDLDADAVERLVRETADTAMAGLGAERVRVLDLNLALDDGTGLRP
jgi:K+-transporting ATPase ATPase C chain